MIVLITLTVAGADTGPFNLYSDIDGYITPFESSVPKSSLVSGYTSTVVPTGTTIIRVLSQGTCDNYIDIPVSGLITTTTTSTTLPACRCYNVTNPTEGALNLAYTPCGQSETTISVDGGLTVSLCVQPYTIIFRDFGLDYPVECSETCSDIITCTTCT